ncbi:hypothetical protein FSY45_19430 [Comamonas sp. Z1]|uniref:hypothetical protein n=1 Tax=Comamonas sp. Z1 TaxID=2601246 RepID=UPI0011E7BEFA|nr:hypothetical protein [Comamonas sp. Z1]TYK74338.1 hypothetical protein FSY45_19430 [Comamonas sp. Z1]
MSQNTPHPAAKPDMRRQLLATARRLGEQAAQAALDRTEQDDPTFSTRAYEFIVSYVRDHGPVPGEAVTLAARCAGIKPAKDDRAFGAVYAKALRDGAIRVVDSTNRVRGHGSAGGKVYGPV